MEILNRVDATEFPMRPACESHEVRNQTNSQFIKPISLLIVLLVTNLAQADNRPNIIVLYTDDHGYADLSCQGVFDDISTPNVDALAKNGVLARNGYSTAPQCVPSRAGLMIGKFQSRFGVETNGNSLDGFNREQTIAESILTSGLIWPADLSTVKRRDD